MSVATSLYIATPMYGGLCTIPYAESILGAVKELKKRGVETRLDFVANESLIQRARNLMAHKFFRSQCTHLLFIDADIGFSFDQLWALLRQSVDVQMDQAVVTGVYCKKYLNWEKIQAKLTGQTRTVEGVTTVGLDYNINVDLRNLGTIQNGFAKVIDAATGFMLIPRKVLTLMYDAYAKELTCRNDLLDQNHDYVAIFDCMICPESRRYLSEDFSFIRRCQAQGVTVLSDLCSKLSHTGCLVLRNDIEYVKDF